MHYVNALAQGGSVALVTTVICMLPVAIVIANWMIEGSTPNKAQVAAIVLAITSVVIIATDMK